MKADIYEQLSVRIHSSLGELITAQKISAEIPDYLESKAGLVYRKYVDPTGSITLSGETIQFLAVLAHAAGSWAELPPFDFINMFAAPNGVGLPINITLETVRLMIKVPPVDFIEGGGMPFECPLKIGNVLVQGVPIMPAPSTLGI